MPARLIAAYLKQFITQNLHLSSCCLAGSLQSRRIGVFCRAIDLDCSADYHAGFFGWAFIIDRGYVNFVVFLDLKKAFDTVDHEIVLTKWIVVEFKVKLLIGLNRIWRIAHNGAQFKGHSQLWDRADLDTTFAQNQMYASATSRNPLHSCLVFHSILDLLQKTCLTAYDIILSYLVKNSIQRNMNRRGEKRVGAGREKSVRLPK